MHSWVSALCIFGTAFLPPSSESATGWVGMTPETPNDLAGPRQKIHKEPKPQKTVTQKSKIMYVDNVKVKMIYRYQLTCYNKFLKF